MHYSKTYYRERHRRRMQNPEYREHQRKVKLQYYYATKDTPEYKAKNAERARHLSRDPLKRIEYKARWQAKGALKAGKIQRQPCKDCGKTKAEMHHPDYCKPLEIEWLCRQCHVRHHYPLINSANQGSLGRE